MKWEIITEYIEDWLKNLDNNSYDLVIASLDLLSEQGPNLKRPIVGKLHSEVCKNLKELRPGSTGKSEIRIIFIFDPERKAVMLVAGDKSGKWKKWHKDNIPLAESIYLKHIQKIASKLAPSVFARRNKSGNKKKKGTK